MIAGRPPLRPTIRHPRAAHKTNRYIGPVMVLCVAALVAQIYWMQTQASRAVRPAAVEGLDPELIDKLRTKLITLYECEFCLNSGLQDDPETPGARILCPICFGVGYHAARRISDDERMCLACSGMGRRPLEEEGPVVFCPTCDGRGMVSTQPQ